MLTIKAIWVTAMLFDSFVPWDEFGSFLWLPVVCMHVPKWKFLLPTTMKKVPAKIDPGIDAPKTWSLAVQSSPGSSDCVFWQKNINAKFCCIAEQTTFFRNGLSLWNCEHSPPPLVKIADVLAWCILADSVDKQGNECAVMMLEKCWTLSNHSLHQNCIPE